jgi:hypothetical protein
VCIGSVEVLCALGQSFSAHWLLRSFVCTEFVEVLCALGSSFCCAHGVRRSFVGAGFLGVMSALDSSKFCACWARRSFVHTGCGQAQDMPMTCAREVQDTHRTGTAQAHFTTHDVSLLFIVFALFSIVFHCFHYVTWFFYCSSLVFIVFVMFLIVFHTLPLVDIVLHCL